MDAEAAGDGTRAVRAGLPPAVPGEPLLPGPTFAAPFHAPEGTPAPYVYGRWHNPTWTRWERAVGDLEGGEAVAYASGQAASAAVLLGLVGPGEAVVLPSDGYHGTRAVAAQARGVEVRLAPTAGDAQGALLAGARLLWLETPSNPGLDVCDIAALAAAAHAAGALVAVDNTTATPLGQRPLELGADLSVASDTKGLTGHGDLLLGHVATRDPELLERLLAWRTTAGSVPGPMETWLAHRSLPTLALRLDRQAATARALAELLVATAGVSDVRYPGLPTHPAAALVARQMRRTGGVVSFTLPSAEAAGRFLGALELVAEATSFGAVHSTAERRARWGDAVAPGFVRFSAGVEDTADVLTDVRQALLAAL